jgi:hypothetical protein
VGYVTLDAARSQAYIAQFPAVNGQARVGREGGKGLMAASGANTAYSGLPFANGRKIPNASLAGGLFFIGRMLRCGIHRDVFYREAPLSIRRDLALTAIYY